MQEVSRSQILLEIAASAARSVSASKRRASSAAAESAARAFAARFIFRAWMSHGFAREINSALLIDIENLDFKLFAFFDDIFSFFNKLIGQLVHTDKPFFSRHNLNKDANPHDSSHFAFVDLPDFGFRGQSYDLRFSSFDRN